MLEITGKEIAELDDANLRSLVGLLCEAELKSQGLPTAGVTWSGHQDAPDGGIDVKVSFSSQLHRDGFIPRSVTGFQVKKSNMRPGDISKEMRPNGKLRESIKSLADEKGAYIIVSSKESTSDSSLIERKHAMRGAISDWNTSDDLVIDFYDSGRIASWVRSHPSLILWVRKKIGKQIQGWQPYENWAEAPGGINEEYLLDEEVRLLDGSKPREDGMKAIDGINKLRSILSQPGSSVRLAGLSGVGKTRMVQALFDERIGEDPLNPSHVFYTDIAYNPTPEPYNFAEQIIALRSPAVIVVDNCPPDLHRRLNSVCTDSGVRVSLITIEYDVREEQPEETEVFRLEPASEKIIEQIINDRFKHVNQVDARTISKFSDGNARIAIALANTVQKGDTLADIKDPKLIERIIYQRHSPDKQLLKIAEVCSLVYSFDNRAEEGKSHELQTLAALAGCSVNDLYSNIAELKRRDLIQQRNYWRAILPHAIANRLAMSALENIPLDTTLGQFESKGSERLLQSFSRRLGYLHESEKAMEITEKWLSKGGLLYEVHDLNSLQIEMLKNIAPINQEEVLRIIERAISENNDQSFASRRNQHYVEFTRLLRKLSYEPDHFERAVSILCHFSLSEDKDENQNSIRRLLASLFHLYLSGTWATVEQRVKVIKRLVLSDDVNERDLGFELLGAALKTSFFTSFDDFDFGARSRDYGYIPRSSEDIINWYTPLLYLTRDLAVSDGCSSKKAKSLFAEKFRGLWMDIRIYDELEDSIKEIIKMGPWEEGWPVVQETLHYGKKEMHQDAVSRLQSLSALLKPTNLLDQARLFAFSKQRGVLDLGDSIPEGKVLKESSDHYQLIEERTRFIGAQVARDKKVYSSILPELLQTQGSGLYSFGKGLAEDCSEPLNMWSDFKNRLASIEEKNRVYQMLRGFLISLSEKRPEVCERILDEAVNDEVLAPVFPFLQTSIPIDSRGLDRLFQSLRLRRAPIYMFNHLAYGQVPSSIDDDELSKLLLTIAQKEEGLAVAIEILNMRFHGIKNDDEQPKEILILTGRNILNQIVFDRSLRTIRSEDYTISTIIKVCFRGDSAREAVRNFCFHLAKAISEYLVFPEDYSCIYESLLAIQPEAFLDYFYEGNEDFQPLPIRWTSNTSPDPLSSVGDSVLIGWCEKKPSNRYPVIASAITPFEIIKETSTYEWTPLALRMIETSPDPVKVLEKFLYHLKPSHGWGSEAANMKECLPLISKLNSHEIPIVREWAAKAEFDYEEEIRKAEQAERELRRNRSEYGFE